MSDAYQDYWRECIAIAAGECGLSLTSEQLDALADAAESGHEHYGLAFYSPPSSDRISDIENEWRRKLKDSEAEIQSMQEKYERDADDLRRRISRIADQRDDAIRELERAR